MSDTVIQPETGNAPEADTQKRVKDWVKPEISKLDLETAQQTG